MKISIRAVEKFFFLILCVWVTLFVKNVTDLSAVGDEEYDRQTEKQALQSIYAVENRIRETRRRKKTTKIYPEIMKPDDASSLYESDADDSKDSIENGKEFSNDANATAASDISGQNEISMLDRNERNKNFLKSRKRQRQGRKKGPRGNRNYHKRSDNSTSPHLQDKPSLLLPTPIIIMGFPKAGTSSIFSFFQIQGLKSQHWFCCGSECPFFFFLVACLCESYALLSHQFSFTNFTEQRHPQKGGPALMADCLLKNLKQNKNVDILYKCGNYDVYSEINGPRQTKQHPEIHNKTGYLLDDGRFDFDGPGNRIFFPQHFRIQELHDAYPNATWILNWRDYDSWIESVIQWGTNDRLHEQFLNEYYMQGVIPSLPKQGNITAVKEIMKEIYHNHHKMVRDFVQDHPTHALVEVNITHENAGAVLAEAFGLNPTAWMKMNKNKGKERNAFDGFDVLASSLWWWLILVATVLCLAISIVPVVS